MLQDVYVYAFSLVVLSKYTKDDFEKIVEEKKYFKIDITLMNS